MIFFAFRQGFYPFYRLGFHLLLDMQKFDIRNPVISKKRVNPLKDKVFSVNENGTVRRGGRYIQRRTRFFLGRFGLYIMDFGRLGAFGIFLTNNFPPVRDNTPQRDIFTLEQFSQQTGHRCRQGSHNSRIMTTDRKNVEGFRKSLLKWYDAHRRVLPWRALPGHTPEPYHVWLSEIMLQQTTVPAVIPYFGKFLSKWPAVGDLANAAPQDVMENWAGLGYYARARNLHKCAKYIAEELAGAFPDTQDNLKKLPGVGDYTSAAITAIAFNKPANVVDGNVERVMARIFAVTEPVPDSKPHLKALAGVMAQGETKRPGDYAQALMDLGATICTPSSPKCLLCPVSSYCDAYAQGIAPDLPARKAKPAKPQKHGYVYWITGPDGRILFERRGEKGMLGGTVGLPTSAWVERAMERTHLTFPKPQQTPVVIRHGFTHFDLELHGFAVILKDKITPNEGDYFWITRQEALKLGIPTLFKKALKQFI